MKPGSHCRTGGQPTVGRRENFIAPAAVARLIDELAREEAERRFETRPNKTAVILDLIAAGIRALGLQDRIERGDQ